MVMWIYWPNVILTKQIYNNLIHYICIYSSYHYLYLHLIYYVMCDSHDIVQRVLWANLNYSNKLRSWIVNQTWCSCNAVHLLTQCCHGNSTHNWILSSSSGVSCRGQVKHYWRYIFLQFSNWLACPSTLFIWCLVSSVSFIQYWVCFNWNATFKLE